MLAGFFVLAVGIIASLGVLASVLFGRGDAEGGSWLLALALILGAPTLYALVRAIWARPRPTGVPLTRATHPELWRHVDELAAIAGTRSPDDIRLVNEANAGVWERRGTRYLELGLPWVAGMTIGELRSVLAHELGHYGGGHTRLSAVTFRAKVALGMMSEQGTGYLSGVLYAWARLYALVAASASRVHERFADEVSVAAAGREASMRSLLRGGPLGAAWADYQRWYVALGVLAGRTPPLLEGFRAYLDHPRRVHQLREIEPLLAAQEPKSVFNSHPPVRERVATIARLSPFTGGVAEAIDERQSWPLLDGTPPEEVAALVGVRGPPITWEELAALAGPALVRQHADLLRHAGRVSKVGETPADVLAALSRAELHKLTGAPVDASLTTEEVHEAAVDAVTELLGCMVADLLVTAGRATLELNWGGLFVLRMPDGAAVYPEDLVAPAVRDANRVPDVRFRLQALGVDGL
ncbi:M48 family metallopeptidase [Lentzea albidocapillata]|uniref:Zn-dependent protease with chaperone function n=1 Tax=Lentzea albidocapillata TaxID=40571 RepID=A0A1W2FLS2_9PSEU|nr:M48 family metallopeptidase [Lentzea albidocapillata]SMD22662.1 Zn-dependent protease with chaperone function [Lentzea albidocapillata]